MGGANILSIRFVYLIMHDKKYLLIFLASATMFATYAQKSKTDSLFKKEAVLAILHTVADWQINDYHTRGFKRPRYDWTNAAGYTGFMELARISADDKYKKFLINVGDSLGWNTGPRRFHADDYCVGQTFANLYMIEKDPKMISQFRQLADSIAAAPHTESLDWKNHINEREWAWCDALFMGPPALGYLSTATNDKKYLDIAAKLWWKTTDYLYDPAEHLYFRDQTFFDKKEKNGKKVFWSRGNGWVLAGLVRVLQNMPADYPDRKRFIKLYKEMTVKIAELQQPDGSWHASLLDPGSYPIKETSETGFYTYAILWGINNKILKKKKYQRVVENGWKALVSSVQSDGLLGYVQAIGAAPGTSDSNSTETYGVGAFLLAGTELLKEVPKNK